MQQDVFIEVTNAETGCRLLLRLKDIEWVEETVVPNVIVLHTVYNDVKIMSTFEHFTTLINEIRSVLS